MKIYRPDQLAILYRSFRFAQRNTLAVGMLGFFRFEQSDLAHLGSEPELWQAVAEALGSSVLDEGYPKPAGEFKVYGKAYAPGGSPVREMQVSARIGTLSKQLWVSGDRHFNAAGLISAAEPFISMPLTPEHAFGGEGTTANPLGKGACAVKLADGREQWPLPNVEAARQRMANRGDIVEAAGFWGFSAGTPLRDRHLGKFDDSWIKRSWPHLPDDTQLEFFHTAPADQRNTGYFAGNETIELRGMHPRRSTLETRLPGLRARCFVHRRESDGKEVFGELEARLDTVWLFPELECGIVLYRTQTSTLDDDASDILHVMAEWERLADAALPFDQYQQLFRQRLQEEAGGAGVQAESVVPAAAPVAGAAESAEPPSIPATMPIAAALVTAPQMTPEIAEAHRLADQLEHETAELLRKNGLSEQDVARFLVPEEEPVVSLAEAERMVDRLEQETRALMKKNDLTDADVQKYLPQQKEPESSLKDLKEMMQSLEKQTSELLQKNGMTEQDVEKFLAARPELAESLQNLKDAKAANVPLSAIPDSFPEIPKVDPQLLQPQDAGLLALGAVAPATPSTSRLTREQVMARHAAKESLAGFDLSGLDLSRLDLSAADFSGSLLEKTAFTGSRLANANLADCLMQEADCSGADLSGAILNNVSAAHSVFTDAYLKSAQIRDADFTGSDFRNAQLQQATLDGAAFEQASMAAVQAATCSAHQSNFSGADLSGANFEQAALTQTMFYGSKLEAANFKAAHCQQAEFYGVDAGGAQFTATNLDESRADKEASFPQAVFDGAQLRRAAWDGTQLSGATFTEAILDDADFSNVHAPDSRFRNASARHTRFGGADLCGADLTGINLFKGSLRKSQIEKAALHFANLYGVDFEGTTVRASAVQEADIGQTILAFRPPLA